MKWNRLQACLSSNMEVQPAEVGHCATSSAEQGSRTGGYQEALAERGTLAPCRHSLVNAVKTSKPQSKFARSKQCKIKPHVGLKSFRSIFRHSAEFRD